MSKNRQDCPAGAVLPIYRGDRNTVNKKLIFLDIDGTLTAPGALAPPESAQRAIREARSKGHEVFLCTGRNYAMMEPLMAYGFDGAIASAGGYVVYDGRLLYDHPMPHELRDRVTGVLDEAGFFWTLEARSGVYGSEDTFQMMLSSRSTDSEAERWKRAMEMDKLGFYPIDRYNGAPIYKIMFIGESRAGLAKIERELGGDFFVCLQNIFKEEDRVHGELINRAFDKGTGVKQICSHLHIPLADAIGFGDSMNDLAMLETVGTGVCMANGEEALKAVSSMVCPAVDEDGLYRAFAELGLI